MKIKFDRNKIDCISLGGDIMQHLKKDIYLVEKYPPEEDFFISKENATRYLVVGFAKEYQEDVVIEKDENRHKNISKKSKDI